MVKEDKASEFSFPLGMKGTSSPVEASTLKEYLMDAAAHEKRTKTTSCHGSANWLNT
jgi:hypothetical protein